MILWAGTAADAKYSGGSGEPNDPYRIATAEDLNDIGNHEEDWDKHFILVNDVNLAQYNGTQFRMIGIYYNNAFTGVFDGNDKSIWNFTRSSTGGYNIGLFGYVAENGQIKNLTLENVDVNAVNGDDVGALAGWNDGTITNCYSSASVLGNESVGGVVGNNGYCGTIANCYSNGSASGKWFIGGLVGANSGEISLCYSSDIVSGEYGVGGLAGGNEVTETITDCYSSGSVSGYVYVGGLVGLNNGTITRCYSSGSVSGNDNVGGLAGLGDPNLVTASFWDKDTSGQTTSAGGVGKTTAEMKTKSTFTEAGWDFVEIWGIGENQTYSYLRTEPAGDLNHDKKVDFTDLAILALHWLEER
jgi:hypothetical protein